MSAVLNPIKGNLYLKWLHSGLYKEAAKLEYHSSEALLNHDDIKEIMSIYNHRGYILSEFNKPLGYVLCEAIDEDLEIISLVVHQDYRRKGHASLILKNLEEMNSDIKIMRYHIRESNLEGQLFLKSQGFRADKIEKKYFSDDVANFVRHEDAYVFWKKVN